MPPRRKRTRVEDDTTEPEGEAAAVADKSQAQPQGSEAAEAKQKRLAAFAEQWQIEGKTDEQILGMSSM